MKVSIIIPCKNEEKHISKCLDSIINANWNNIEKEIIICDGKSTDKTLEIINEYSKKYDFIKVFTNEKEIAPTAMNIGIKNSTGNFITRIDAHAEIEKDFIINSLKIFEKDDKIACSGGIIESIYDNKISKSISLAMSSSFGVGSAYFRTGLKDSYVDTLAFGTYKKEIFDIISLFDEELVRNQDDELNFRLTKSGYKIYLSKDIKSKYYVRSSLEKLFKQYYQYGYWKVYVNKKHRTFTNYRQLVPFLFIVFLFSLILGLIYKPYFYLYSGILILYFLLAFIFAYKKTNNISEIFTVILSFLILHISYGFGYLQGIIHFIIFNKKPSNKNKILNR